MTVQYRYLRPLAYDFKRAEEYVPLKGGICFRLETDDTPMSMAEVSWSICHSDDLFNKSVAKKIADQRHANTVYMHLDPTSPLNVWAQMLRLISAIGEDAIKDDNAFEMYKRLDLHNVGRHIVQILQTHRQVQQIKALDRSTIEALKFRELYENQSR